MLAIYFSSWFVLASLSTFLVKLEAPPQFTGPSQFRQGHFHDLTSGIRSSIASPVLPNVLVSELPLPNSSPTDFHALLQPQAKAATFHKFGFKWT